MVSRSPMTKVNPEKRTVILRKDKLFYDWLFHYNAYSDFWFAFHREDQSAYWNGHKSKFPILKAKELKTLMATLQETKGDKTLLNERISNITKSASGVTSHK